MKKYIIFIFFSAICMVENISGQDLCTTATPLTVGANDACVNITGDNTGATDSGELPAPSCASYSGSDVWFSITVPAGGEVSVQTDDAGGFTDGGLSVYSGACGALTEVECDDDDGPGLFGLIELTGQTPGATLFVRVWEFGGDAQGAFSICAFAPAPPPPAPANDLCAGAIALTVGANDACVNITGSNESTTDSGELPAPSCASYSGGDVWFSVTVPASGNVSVQTDAAGGFTDGGLSVYSGACGALTEVECDDDDGPGLFGLIELTGQTPGATLFVRVWEFGNNLFGDFSICAFEPAPPPPPPANDDCAGAIALPVNPDLNCGMTTSGTIEASTDSGVTTGCFGTSDDDVWYSFVATSTVHNIDLLNVTGSTTDLYHVVMTDCTMDNTDIVCSDPNNSVATGLTVGDTYFVQVYSWTGTAGQDTNFDICIGTPPPPPANDDCATPTPICGTDVINGSNASASTVAFDPTITCLGSIENTVWYSFQSDGTGSAISFTITELGACVSDLQIGLLSGVDCAGAFVEEDCSQLTTIHTLTLATPVTGDTYYIYIDGNGGAECGFTIEPSGGIEACIVVCDASIAAATAPVAVVSSESACEGDGVTLSGGVIAAPAGSCPAGSTLNYSLTGAAPWSPTLPTYDQMNAITVTTVCLCDMDNSVESITAEVATVPGVCPTCDAGIAAATAPVAVVSSESMCQADGVTLSGGVIAAPTGACPTGSTINYSTTGAAPWSTVLPMYDQANVVTVTTVCLCDLDNSVESATAEVATVPGNCSGCATAITTATAPLPIITESVCMDVGGTPSGGMVAAPTDSCPAGSTLEYSTDSGANWVTALPGYVQAVSVTIMTRCSCDADGSVNSASSMISTVPGTCPTAPGCDADHGTLGIKAVPPTGKN